MKLGFDTLGAHSKGITAMRWFRAELDIAMSDEDEAHVIAVARKLVPTQDQDCNHLSPETQIVDLGDAVDELIFSNPLFMVGGLEVQSYSVRELPPEEIPAEEVIEWPEGLGASAAAEYIRGQLPRQSLPKQMRKAHLEHQRLKR